MSENLCHLFSPRSIAIIGASNSPEKVGAVVLKNIIDSGYSGKIFPVNPTATEINGLKSYPNVSLLPQIPDLAVMAVPSPIVIKLFPELIAKKIKNLVILSAGFKETGQLGQQLENELSSLVTKHHLHLLGPNCLGFADNHLPLNLTFGQLIKTPGKIRLISQSGALATALFDWFSQTGLGFDSFVTLGNKTNLDESHVLDFWLKHSPPPFSSPVGLYLESISQGQKFLSLAQKISHHAPVFVLKPGKSPAAAQAMRSHTGSIAGEDDIFDLALKQSGLIRCQNLSDFFDLYQAISWVKIPAGPNVAIISNAGGPAVMATDALDRFGLKLANLTPQTQKSLQNVLPPIASLHNPIDIMGDALSDRFAKVLEIIYQDKSIDSILLILSPQLMTDIENIANTVGLLSKKYSKPLLCSFIGGQRVLLGQKILYKHHLPCYSFPEKAAQVFGSLWAWQQWRQKQYKSNSKLSPLSSSKLKTAQSIISKVESDYRQTFNSFEADNLIKSVGINTPPSLAASSLTQAQDFALKHHWPVVLKLSSPGLLHKSDLGGVITHINNPSQLNAAWNDLSQKIITLKRKIGQPISVQIQKQIIGGLELILGVKRDPIFGPVFLFGAGGQLAELIQDKNLHLLPFDQSGLKQLVANSKIFPLLSGYRGQALYPLDPLYRSILRLSQLAQSFPNISEIEINPVLLTRDHLWAVDAKVITKPCSSSLP